MAGGFPEEKKLTPPTFLSSSLRNGSSARGARDLLFEHPVQLSSSFSSSSSSLERNSEKGALQTESVSMKSGNDQGEEGQASGLLHCEEEGDVEEALTDFANLWSRSGGFLGGGSSSPSSSPITRASAGIFAAAEERGKREGGRDGQLVVDSTEKKKKPRSAGGDGGSGGGEEEEGEEETGFLRYCRIFFGEQERQEAELLRQPLEELERFRRPLESLLEGVSCMEDDISKLLTAREELRHCTSGMHSACRHLLQEQTHLKHIIDLLQHRLSYYTRYEGIRQLLEVPRLILSFSSSSASRAEGDNDDADAGRRVSASSSSSSTSADVSLSFSLDDGGTTRGKQGVPENWEGGGGGGTTLDVDGLSKALQFIDEATQFFAVHTAYAEAHTYLSRYESLRTRATCILRTAVLQTLENCQRSVLAAQQKSSAGQSSASCPSSQHDAKTDQGGGGGGGEERGGREGVDAEGKMPSDDRSVSTFSSSSSGGGVLGGGGVGKGGRVRLLDISIYHVPFRLAGLTLKPLTTLLSERYQRGVHESYGSTLEQIEGLYVGMRLQLILPPLKEELQRRLFESQSLPDASRRITSYCLSLCDMEEKTFFSFFPRPPHRRKKHQEGRALATVLEAIGNCAYDCIRPAALACSALDDLSEIIETLSLDILQPLQIDKIKAAQLAPFLSIVVQLVHDIQERLVFRADAEIEERIRTREVSEDTLAVFFLSSMVGLTLPASGPQQSKGGQGGGEGGEQHHHKLFPPVDDTLRIISLLHRAMSSDYAFSSLCGSSIEACLDTMTRVYTAVSRCLGTPIGALKNSPKLFPFFMTGQTTRSSLTSLPSSAPSSLSHSAGPSSSSPSRTDLESSGRPPSLETLVSAVDTPLDLWLWQYISFELETDRRRSSKTSSKDGGTSISREKVNGDSREKDERRRRGSLHTFFLSREDTEESEGNEEKVGGQYGHHRHHQTKKKRAPLFPGGVQLSSFHEMLREIFMLENLLIVKHYVNSFGDEYEFRCVQRSVALPSFSLPFFSRGDKETGADEHRHPRSSVSSSASSSSCASETTKREGGMGEGHEKRTTKESHQGQPRRGRGVEEGQRQQYADVNSKEKSTPSFFSWLMPKVREEVHDARDLLSASVERHTDLLISSISCPLSSPLTRVLVQLPKDVEEDLVRRGASNSSAFPQSPKKQRQRAEKKEQEQGGDLGERREKDERRRGGEEGRGGEQEEERESVRESSRERDLGDLLCLQADHLRRTFEEYFYFLKKDFPKILLTLLLLFDAPAAVQTAVASPLSSVPGAKTAKATLRGEEGVKEKKVHEEEDDEEGKEKEEVEDHKKLIESIRFLLDPLLSAILEPYRQISVVLFSYLHLSQEQARDALLWRSEEELRIAIFHMAVYKVAPVALRVYRHQGEEAAVMQDTHQPEDASSSPPANAGTHASGEPAAPPFSSTQMD